MSPAPSTSDRDDAAKLQDRVRRAKASLSQIGGGEPDPEDLGAPIEVEGADEILSSVVAPPAPSTSWPAELDATLEEAVALEVADGSAATFTATEGVVPAEGWTAKEFFTMPATPDQVVTAAGPITIGPGTARQSADFTWRNAQDPGEVRGIALESAEAGAPLEVELTPPPPAVPRETAAADPPKRTKRKIGIIGYTGSRRLAPYGDPEWELWGLNNLHLAEDIDVTKFEAWFDLHPRTEIVKDDVHRGWLEGGSAGLPCFVWGDGNGEPPADWPNAVAYPQQHVLDSFPPYFTNSISWMTALAITILQQRAEEQGLGVEDCELGVWGVDMATDGEYAQQRPSCEFFIGVAMGLGLPVTIPESSDLLKAATLYGLETSPMLAKIQERKAEIQITINAMSQAHAQHEAEARQLEANINAGRGALDQLSYLEGTWFQPTNAGNSTHESPPA